MEKVISNKNPQNTPSVWDYFNVLFVMVTGSEALPEILKDVTCIHVGQYDGYIEVMYVDADGSKGSFTRDMAYEQWGTMIAASTLQALYNPALTFDLSINIDEPSIVGIARSKQG